ncbi:MAG: hypothetical protein AABZ32_05515 [Bacteroidota bacterium]
MLLFTDAHHVAGYQAYQFLKAFYGEAQAMKDRGVAGADSLVDELAPLFAQGSATDEGLKPFFSVDFLVLLC